MLLYHLTEHGDRILAEGFRDAEGTYLTRNVYRGVWVSDRPLGINEVGGEGEDILAVDVAEAVVAEYEWIEDCKPYREFLVPAAILNEHTVLRRWECDGCGAVVIDVEPAGWRRETRFDPAEHPVIVTLCPECSKTERGKARS
jgi:hypothetical protein